MYNKHLFTFDEGHEFDPAYRVDTVDDDRTVTILFAGLTALVIVMLSAVLSAVVLGA